MTKVQKIIEHKKYVFYLYHLLLSYILSTNIVFKGFYLWDMKMLLFKSLASNDTF